MRGWRQLAAKRVRSARDGPLPGVLRRARPALAAAGGGFRLPRLLRDVEHEPDDVLGLAGELGGEVAHGLPRPLMACSGGDFSL